MVVRDHPALSLSRQCRLLSIGRSSLYCKPKEESAKTAQAVADVEDIAAGVLGRQPGRAELRTLYAVGRGPGGLHALRRLLGRAWMVAQAAGRDAIEASDITAASDEGTAADKGRDAGAAL